ncbi:AbiTii domain-containing protein [Embleya sp. NPDC055664]
MKMNRQDPTAPTHEVPGESPSVASLLRRYVTPGDDAEFARVWTWAQHELRGYDDAPLSDLPAYRLTETLPKGLRLNAEGRGWMTVGEPVDNYGLPEACRAWVPERVPLRHGVDEIEGLIAARTCFDNFIEVSPPHAEEIALLLTEQGRPSGGPFTVTAVYWYVPYAALSTLLDRIRDQLSRLVQDSGAADGHQEATSHKALWARPPRT